MTLIKNGLTPQPAIVLPIVYYWLNGGSSINSENFVNDLEACVQNILSGKIHCDFSNLHQDLDKILNDFINTLLITRSFYIPPNPKNWQNNTHVVTVLSYLLNKSGDKERFVSKCIDAVNTILMKHKSLLLARQFIKFIESDSQITPEMRQQFAPKLAVVFDAFKVLLKEKTPDSSEEDMRGYVEWVRDDQLSCEVTIRRRMGRA